MPKDRLLKIALHDRYGDVEWTWAADLGAYRRSRTKRRVRLMNVPFLHAKPTWGDDIIVSVDPELDGAWAWDRGGATPKQVGTRIAKDGGFYAMVVDYRGDDQTRFGDMTHWVRSYDLVTEGVFGPTERRPGRLYLAVPAAMKPAKVMALLAENAFGFRFERVHPPAPLRLVSSR
jgi:hypothetical protein